MAKDIGKRLRILRKLHDMTQEKLGDILHYSRSQIGNIEGNRRNLLFEDMQTLSEYFNISIMYFLDENFFLSNNELLFILDSEEPLDITQFTIDDKIKIAKMYVDLMKRYRKKNEPILNKEKTAE